MKAEDIQVLVQRFEGILDTAKCVGKKIYHFADVSKMIRTDHFADVRKMVSVSYNPAQA